MALIKCPDCGKEISDTASSCPNCGRMTSKEIIGSIPGISVFGYILAFLAYISGIYWFIKGASSLSGYQADTFSGYLFIGAGINIIILGVVLNLISFGVSRLAWICQVMTSVLGISKEVSTIQQNQPTIQTKINPQSKSLFERAILSVLINCA